MYHLSLIFWQNIRSKWGVQMLAKIYFSYTFVQETRVLDFCEGARHYDVTETKYWYLIWYQCLEETLS